MVGFENKKKAAMFSYLEICPSFFNSVFELAAYALYQEQAVFVKMKMDPAKRAKTQNAGEVS